MFYSKSTNGFYDPTINANIPNDAVEITKDKHAALLIGQSRGKIISSDENGSPILIDQTINLAEIVRYKRNQLLLDTQWLVQRHRDQIEVSEPTTLTADQYKALLTYRQALRDVTLQKDFPTKVIYPKYPI